MRYGITFKQIVSENIYMLKNYRDLTRLEMEQVDKNETIILIPVGSISPPWKSQILPSETVAFTSG